MSIPCHNNRRRNLAASIYFFVALVAALFSGGKVNAQTPEFADYLFQQEDYYRAITEYQRVLFHAEAEDLELRSYATVQIGEALFSGREFYRAAAWLEPRLRVVGVEPHRTTARRLLCRSLVAARDAESLRDVANEIGEPERGFYGAFAFGMSRRWDQAVQAFSAIPAESPYYAAAQHDRLVALSASAAPWKNPTKAGVLAVVPGLGYLYAGHRKSALTSLLMNSGFALATIHAFDSGQSAFGAVLAMFSVSWYWGNIVGSAAAAHRANAFQNEIQMEQLLD
jgi:hypothetical protein